MLFNTSFGISKSPIALPWSGFFLVIVLVAITHPSRDVGIG
jgi:hypothetical protein